jgi:hypothetical protein
MKRKIFSAILISSLFIGLAIFQWGTGFVRGYGGDVIVMIFLYALVSIITT